MERSRIEERVLARVRDGREELVGLLSELVACDTTSRGGDEPARDEEKLQAILAGRLRTLGAEVRVWEPEPIEPGETPACPVHLDFRGRPQLVARMAGAGGGRSLLLNGHIDAVPYGDLDRWQSHPLKAEVRDGRLYGRGASDMKGAIASFVHVLECLRAEGVAPAGDVLLATNTEEESTGTGGLRVAQSGLRADAGITGEPTGFDVWAACRGAITVAMEISGRTGHAEMPQANWRDGGAVNAIERLDIVLATMRRLRDDWRTRHDSVHPLLSVPDIVPTMVHGGEWTVTYPDRCRLTFDVEYLPARVDECGWAQGVRDEVESAMDAAAAADSWLVEHPFTYEYLSEAVPAEVPADHDIVRLPLECAAELGREGRVSGLDSWHDAATFTRFGTPTVSFGPGGFESAHRENEYVPVDHLVDHACAVALVVLRFCGV